jgi:hypothetical protein
LTKKGKAKPSIELEEEPNFTCESYHQWSENDDEDMYWDCRKDLVPKDADCCPVDCPGFKLKKGG